VPTPDLPLPTSLTPSLERWAQVWTVWNSAAFLTTYLQTAGNAEFIPALAEDRRRLLNLFQLEKAMRQLSHAVSGENRWAIVALRSVLYLLDQSA
jgi:maltose alpha-D-glucosyltransferase/alpha-amylase